MRTVSGDPIQGATVTLLRSDSDAGPFEVVPNGSAVTSPSNRTNPDTTDSDGHFGWDVIASFYKVRVSKAGCASPTDPSHNFVESAVMTIPPPVTDLDLRLDCDTQAPTVTKVVPRADARGVSRSTNVATSFSEKMKGSTINQLTFRLFKKGSARALGARVIYNARSKTATLNPNKQLLGGATYKATVTTGAKDLAGNPLATNKVWSFKTRF